MHRKTSYVSIACLIFIVACVIFSGCVDESKLTTNATMRAYNYTLNGNHGTISSQLYGGLNDYLHTKEPTLYVRNEDDIYKSVLDDKYQDKYMVDIISQIKSKSSDPDTQAKIAISMVQNINYSYGNDDKYKTVYPYEVLYKQYGICSGKSLLLSYLLKNMGYSVSLLVFDDENHMAVGIKTDNISYTYKNTGYAFVETNIPAIITDGSRSYAEFGLLTSVPKVIQISEGKPLNNISDEYTDAIVLDQLADKPNFVPSPIQYRQWETIMWKYGMTDSSGKKYLEDPAGKPLCEGNRICNGHCYQACLAGQEWICDSSGGKCKPSGNVYTCNNQWWSACPLGRTFMCMPSGGVCY
jgi:hypothetical protein